MFLHQEEQHKEKREGETMEECRDSAIKLFGKTIPLRPSEMSASVTGSETYQVLTYPNYQELSEPTTSSISSEAQNPCIDQHTQPNNSRPEEHHNFTSKFPEQTPKKSDGILPCPRCHNMDTKFCYFNNYNLNQPRHFCKNCQRYWTAGGTMRNVPLGAGRRRKKKRSASHYPHIIQAVQSDSPGQSKT